MVALVLGGSAAAALEVRGAVEPEEIPLHHTAVYTLTVEHDAGDAVALPDLAEHFEGLDLHGAPEVTEEALEDGRRRVSAAYVLDPLYTGRYAIDEVTVVAESGAEAVAPLQVLSVRPLTEEEEAAVMQFAANMGPASGPPGLWARHGRWVVGAFTALAAAAVLWGLARRFRTAAAPTATPRERALNALDALESKGAPVQDGWDPFYTELTAIIRGYVAEQFEIKASERTTQEFLEIAAMSGVFTEEEQAWLSGLLRHGDRVKFARMASTGEDTRRHLDEARAFVEETAVRRSVRLEEAAA